MNFKSYFLVFFMLLIVPMFAKKTVRVLPFGRLIADGITAAVKSDPADNLWFTEQSPHAFAADSTGKRLRERKGSGTNEYPLCAACATYRKDHKCGFVMTVETIEETSIDNPKTIDLLKNKEALKYHLQRRNEQINNDNRTISIEYRLPHLETLTSYTLSDAEFAALSIDERARLAAEDTALKRHRFIRGRRIVIATVVDQSIAYVDCKICNTLYRNGRCGFIIEEDTDCCGLFSCLRRLYHKSKKGMSSRRSSTTTGAGAGAGSSARPKDD